MLAQDREFFFGGDLRFLALIQTRNGVWRDVSGSRQVRLQTSSNRDFGGVISQNAVLARYGLDVGITP
jgi:hypothetical protein